MKYLKLIIASVIVVMVLCGCGKSSPENDGQSMGNGNSIGVSSDVSEGKAYAEDSQSSDPDSSIIEKSADLTTQSSETSESTNETDPGKQNSAETTDTKGELSPNDPKRYFNDRIELTPEQSDRIQELNTEDGVKHPYETAKIFGYSDESGHKLTFDDVKRLVDESHKKYPIVYTTDLKTRDEKLNYLMSQLYEQKKYVQSGIMDIQYFPDYSGADGAYYWPETYDEVTPKSSLGVYFKNDNVVLSVTYREYDKDGKITNEEILYPSQAFYDEFYEKYGYPPGFEAQAESQ